MTESDRDVPRRLHCFVEDASDDDAVASILNFPMKVIEDVGRRATPSGRMVEVE
jgi:hypothetical protein